MYFQMTTRSKIGIIRRHPEGARLILVIPLLLALFTLDVFADVSVRMNVQPQILHLGESAACKIIITGVRNPPPPVLPPVPGLRITGPARQYEFSFGTSGHSVSSTYTYNIFPLQTGKFTIGPLKYSLNKADYTLGPVKLTVVDTQQPTDSQHEGHAPPAIFARISCSNRTIYLQQPFSIVVSVYSHELNLGDDIQLLNLPESGLTFYSLQRLSSGRELVAGRIYDVRRYRLPAQALSAGTFTFKPTIQASVLIPRRRPRRLFDDPFFNDFPDFIFGGQQVQNVTLQPNPISITVNPLPEENRPTDYSGAIGHFTLDADVKPRRVAVGEPVTLTTTISGYGNIKSVPAPQISTTSTDFRIYEPRLTSSQINPSGDSGRKQFETVLIPRSIHSSQIPAVKFTFFDPQEKKYITLSKGPFDLILQPTSNATPLVLSHPTARPSDVAILGNDIVYLKHSPLHWKPFQPLAGRHPKLFLAVQVIPLLMVMGALGINRRKHRLATDPHYHILTAAARKAASSLENAKRALSRNNRKDFFDSLGDALLSSFAAALDIPPGNMDASEILSRLKKDSSLDDKLINELKDIFQRIDFERFARMEQHPPHAEDQSDLQDLLERTRSLIRISRHLRLRRHTR